MGVGFSSFHDQEDPNGGTNPMYRGFSMRSMTLEENVELDGPDKQREDGVPFYMKMDYILTGYRVGGSYKDCLLSLFWFHNEWVNAWTMIINVVAAIIMTCYSLISVVPNLPTSGDRAFNAFLFIVFFFSCALHAPFSVGNHIFQPINETAASLWRRLDIVFIFVVCHMLCFSMSYYVFYVDSLWLLIILNVASVLIAVVASVKTCAIPAGTPTDKKQVTTWVTYASLTYIFPIVYQAVSDLMFHGVLSMSVISAILVCGGLGAGAIILVLHWPEKRWPGSFDIWGSSHQIMHVTLLIGYIGEYLHLLDMCYRHYGLPSLMGS